MNNEVKLTRFSPSMLIQYVNCPLEFYYKNIAKIKLPEKRLHLEFGTGVHAGIEAMFNQLDPYEHFKLGFNKDNLLDEEKHEYDEYFKLGMEMIKNYLKDHETLEKLYNLNDGISELYIRRTIVNPLTGETSSLPLSGKIDRLTTEGRIIEYKTSKNKWNPNDIAFKLQTLLYNLWYYAEYGKTAKETVYIILIKKYKKVGKGETTQVLANHSSLDDLASAFDEVEMLLHKIKNREFDRPTGYHAKWCSCWELEKTLNLTK